MKRRTVISGLVAAATMPLSATAQSSDEFTRILDQISANPKLVEETWLVREPNVSRGVGHGQPSRRELNSDAFRLIRDFEVSSPNVYERLYRRPIWPQGSSGVTFGIGYDLGYANRFELDRDWPKLSLADRNLLATVLQIKGKPAEAACRKVSSVDVSYAMAEEQFKAFLPYPTKQTEDAFPNCAMLSEDSFGALVSLVYNRGPGGPNHDRNSDKRREMFQIYQAMRSAQESQIAGIPELIRSMKRIWPTVNGLKLRREAEAALFARGLPAKS